MEYNNFIQSSLLRITASREELLKTELIPEIVPIPNQPSNIYIELVVQKNGKLRKIQQWNFVSLQNLIASEYNESVDSELDSVVLKQKPYFEILEEKLLQFSPKFLVKVLKPSRMYIKLKTGQEDLTPFIEESNYLIEVYDYEGPDYSSHVSLKTIHNQLPRSVRASDLMSSDEQFQELVDPDFQRQVRPQKSKQEQVMKEKPPNMEQIRQPMGQMNLSTKEVGLSVEDPNLATLHEAAYLISTGQYEGWTLGQFLDSLQ